MSYIYIYSSVYIIIRDPPVYEGIPICCYLNLPYDQ